MSSEYLWVERYRPSTISDTILPKRLKDEMQKIIDGGEVPNMILSGTAGLGKTTVAKALCNQLDLDYIMINGSEQGNIDTLRGKIKQFASSVSLQGGYKVVILDEADHLNPQSTQPALRAFIEEFSSNCRFIMTCNYKNRIIEPLHSRCSVVEFNCSRQEMVGLCGQFMKRLQAIVLENGIEADNGVLAEIIKTHAPDWRRVLNEAQRSAIGQTLNQLNASESTDSAFDKLFDALKNKNFKKMRTWVVDHSDFETSTIFRGLYDNMSAKVKSNSIPHLILILADYQHRDAFVADHELNVVACMTEIMGNVEFV